MVSTSSLLIHILAIRGPNNGSAWAQFEGTTLICWSRWLLTVISTDKLLTLFYFLNSGLQQLKIVAKTRINGAKCGLFNVFTVFLFMTQALIALTGSQTRDALHKLIVVRKSTHNPWTPNGQSSIIYAVLRNCTHQGPQDFKQRWEYAERTAVLRTTLVIKMCLCGTHGWARSDNVLWDSNDKHLCKTWAKGNWWVNPK